jgi:ATP-dependent exoDNAse (exonuclease V) beta subunit
MTDLPDAEARHRILTEFDTTFFVEAAAGTGKTTALVGRIVALVRQGLGRLDRVVAVTFTDKAAGEMKLRLRTEIERARQDCTREEQLRLEQALRELELARIGTIHSFCGDLLRERPVEAEVDPLFEILPEDEARDLADQAFEGWFQAALADPPEGVRRILRRRSKRQPPRELLRSALDGLINCRDFPTSWRRDRFDRVGAINSIMAELKALGALSTASFRSQDYLTRNLTEIQRFVVENTQLEAVRGPDYDGLEASLRELVRSKSWGWKGSNRTTFGSLSRDEVLARRDRAKVELDALISASDADLAPLLHQELEAAVNSYQELKAQAGRLDFLDLLIRARDLIRDNGRVRNELQQRFTHYFVDEFQDTDPLQAELLLLLAADDPRETDWRKVRPLPGKLFFVGDPKQSIYRFRRADVALYEDVKRRLIAVGAEPLYLTTSFRALPSIQSLVNAAFAPVMTASPNGSQADYVPLQPSRPEISDRPSVIALPVPRPYTDYGKITNWKIEESFPDAAGALIDWLVNESGWTVEENNETVPIRPRHVCVLFRRFRNFGADVTRPYVRALEARRIPHVLVGGRSFHDREEIIGLLNALTAIEWPDDELRVFATLRGPFFGLRDDALLAYRQHIDADGSLRTRRLHPMHIVDSNQLDQAANEVADALALLAKLHIGRNHRPIVQTLSMLLEGLRAHAGVALWPTGEQALANSSRLLDLARSFEGSATSFRAFVERMEADAERGDAGEAPIVEEGTEGVRMMTVHKAKGLEFPVVVLADPTCSAVWTKPSRHVVPERQLWLQPLCGCSPPELMEAAAEELERDQAEAVRLAYVAATRARDLIVVPVLGDKPITGWLDVLNQVVYPPEDTKRRSAVAPGCPPFGEDSVLDRGPDGAVPVGGPVRPGLYRPVTDGPWIVWWDPAALKLDVQERAPLRQQRILEADPEGTAAKAGEENYSRWKDNREELLAQASHPSISVKTVTSLGREQPDGAKVQVEVVTRSEVKRPSGRRFGTLVHSMLATVSLRATPEEIGTVASMHGKLVGASQDEIDAAVKTVGAALAHPLMCRAASVGTIGLRREAPILLQCDDGSLTEGVVDLAFREEGPGFAGWTVVDFKTDREFETGRAEYSAQVALYVEAIKRATHSAARGILLVL